MLYARKINLKNKNDSNVLLFDMVNFGSRVLDVGCACGDLSAVLAQEKNVLVSEWRLMMKACRFVESEIYLPRYYKLI